MNIFSKDILIFKQKKKKILYHNKSLTEYIFFVKLNYLKKTNLSNQQIIVFFIQKLEKRIYIYQNIEKS